MEPTQMTRGAYSRPCNEGRALRPPISSAVMTEMRGCLIAMVDRAIKEVKNGDNYEVEKAKLLHLKGHLLQDQGRYGAAESAFVECLAYRRVHLGDDHDDTLQTLTLLDSL